MPRPSSTRARPAAVAALLGCGLAACSGSGGTEPQGMLTRLRAGASLAGEWVFQGATPSSAPMLGDRIVGDTLFLRPDLSGTWSITQVDPLDATQRRRSAITLRWESRNDSLWVIPTCEPRELCDPIPPWVGTLTANGTLGLVPAFATGHVYAVRDYRRED